MKSVIVFGSSLIRFVIFLILWIFLYSPFLKMLIILKFIMMLNIVLYLFAGAHVHYAMAAIA